MHILCVCGVLGGFQGTQTVTNVSGCSKRWQAVQSDGDRERADVTRLRPAGLLHLNDESVL